MRNAKSYSRAFRHIQRAQELLEFGVSHDALAELSFGVKKRKKRSYTLPGSTKVSKVPIGGFTNHDVERVTSKNRSSIIMQLREYLKTYTSKGYYDGWKLDDLLLDTKWYPANEYETYVLRHKDTVIGFCGISKRKRNMFYLFVFEEFRRHGAGTALVLASNAKQWSERDSFAFWRKFNALHPKAETQQ
jgi:hypothetical protein